MLFCLHCFDHPGTTELRLKHRPAHKAHLAKIADQIAFAGPLLADDGVTMIGSLVVFDFPNRAAVEAWLAEEPFTQNGVYANQSLTVYDNLWPQKVGFPKS